MVKMIVDLKEGLDPDILAEWYQLVVEEARRLAPPHLAHTIQVRRHPILTLKFEVSASRRVVPHLIRAIETYLPRMPLATRLYFQKLEEIILDEARSFDYRSRVNR